MAIISEGRVLLTGEPQPTIDGLRGKVWMKTIPRQDLERHSADHVVISTRLVSGRTVVHVFAEARPDASFQEVPPDLEDVYFSTLKGAGARLAA